MKHAEIDDLVSRYESVTPHPRGRIPAREKVNAVIRSLLAPRLDPARLSKVEQREMGITEAEINWYNALHGPLVK